MGLAPCASNGTALPTDAWSADHVSCELRAASHAVVPLLARASADFAGAQAWSRLGFSRLCDYTRERLQRSDRWLRELAALGRGMQASPQLERALLGWDGGPPIGRIIAEHLARVATPESMDRWIALARTHTVRQLEEALAAPEGLNPEGLAQPESDDAEMAGAVGEAAPDFDAAERTALEDELSERAELRFGAPEEVQAAFYDTLDVYRAVSGYESTVRSFWEALVAEASAGPFPPDVASMPVQHGVSTRTVEHAMARATHNWAHLDKIPAAEDIAGPADAQAATMASIAEILDLGARRVTVNGRDGDAWPAGEDVSSADLERRVQVLLACDDALERSLGEVLYGMSRRNDWAALGFRSLGHYATERLGLKRSTAYARVAIRRDLERLPQILDAYLDGTIGIESARLLADTLEREPRDVNVERAWIEHARRVTVKRLRDELRFYRCQPLQEAAAGSAQTQDSPTSPHDDSAVHAEPGTPRVHLGDEDRAPTRRGRRGPRLPLPDGVWDTSLRRAAGDTLDRLARLHVPGEDAGVPTSSALGNFGPAMRFRLPGELAGRVRAALEAARQRLVSQARPWVDDEGIDLQHLAPSKRGALVALRRGRRVPAWAGLLALLEDFAITWDNPAGFPKRDKDAVYEKAGFRCQAPGCTRRCNIEDHHIVYRAHQGSDQLWNQLCLCRFHHHQGEHGLFARCRGRAPLDVLWRLGVKEYGVLYRNERRLDVEQFGVL